MSDSSSAPTAKAPKPARPLNRWGAGTLAVLQTLFFVVILVALNYLAENHYQRLDLSRQADYTLSARTKDYLKGPAVADHAKPIKWIMAFRRSSPFYERVRALAEEYERLSGGRIELEVVDPLRSSDRAQEVIAAYGLPLTKDLIIMDARSADGAVSTEEQSRSDNPDADSTPQRILNPNIKLVVAEDMIAYSTENGQRRPTGFQGEDVLTARLIESIEGRARKMVFISDKSQIDLENEDSPLKALQTLLRFQNIELQGISLSGLQAIPEDAEGVALVAPKYDVTDAELKVLEDYWNRPRAALLVLLKAGDTPPKLRTFLRGNGVTPYNDRVISMNDKNLNTVVRGLFTYNIDFTKPLAGQSTLLGGATSSMEVREQAEDLMNKQINAVPLILAAPGFWGETKFGQKVTAFDPMEDHAAPLALAAAVTRGAASDDRFATETSRMVVIANTDFLRPDQQQAENVDFLALSANWLMNRKSLFGIGPRTVGTYKLPLLDAQVSFINRVNLFFLPTFLLLTGLFVWSSRRA
jgi:hypothetical protein